MGSTKTAKKASKHAKDEHMKEPAKRKRDEAGAPSAPPRSSAIVAQLIAEEAAEGEAAGGEAKEEANPIKWWSYDANGSGEISFDEMAEEMLRPMLQDWLDNNLPTLVEKLVREEIERVARGG